jgi:signal transduction histidine kinase
VRPIEHDQEVLGALSVETRRGEVLIPTEIRLVEDLAGSAGLLMRRLRLDAELKEKARDLVQSRRRLVDAQDVERRRLERELNQGAQKQAEELGAQVRVAARRARQEGADRSAPMIDQLVTEAQDAVDQIRSLALGIYPPLLEREGLTAAIAALTDQAPADVHLDATATDRHPLAVEAAIYFCTAEALTNAIKYGTGPVTVAVSDANGELAFAVSDSGPGFDPKTVRRGAGLNNLADRLDALGGALAIDSAPGRNTTISGKVPARATATV